MLDWQKKQRLQYLKNYSTVAFDLLMMAYRQQQQQQQQVQLLLLHYIRIGTSVHFALELKISINTNGHIINKC